MRYSAAALSCLLFASLAFAGPGDGNRLAYLDAVDPYYVSGSFARLTTPQWVGEEGVEAVVLLSIDDMRDSGKYEAFLRPILDRLKRIDGRAAMSIFTNSIPPNDAQVRKWLVEGLSIEVHTLAHPCPLLSKGDLAEAKKTVDGCIDLLATIPNMKPVAFRMPCCDSMNSLSPRFFTEIFNRVTPDGHYLSIDTSVFNVTTPADAALPRDLFTAHGGERRLSKYIPAGKSFVNTIDNYPYPYVIGRLAWEFPCAVPSDWEAQHLHGVNNPITVADMAAAIDAAVVKQGQFTLVFHPHGWIANTQIVELIDHVAAKHGRKVKFLSFADAARRLTEHALSGEPLRAPDGGDNGVRLLDLNHDGYMDVVIGNERVRRTRLWSPAQRKWVECETPTALVRVEPSGRRIDTGVRFSVLRPDGFASMGLATDEDAGLWHFNGEAWSRDDVMTEGLMLDDGPLLTASGGVDRGVRARDLNGDGICEIIVSNERQQAIFQWAGPERWKKLPFTLPGEARLVDAAGRDGGVRFIDLDADGDDDVVYSNESHFGVYLFTSMTEGWPRQVRAGRAGEPGSIPLIARHGTNNGAWVHSGHIWWQNEDTDRLPNVVDRRSFTELLTPAQ